MTIGRSFEEAGPVRHRHVAAAVGAALLLAAGCAPTPASPPATAPAPAVAAAADVAAGSTQGATGGDPGDDPGGDPGGHPGGADGDEYWSNERLAALEAARRDNAEAVAQAARQAEAQRAAEERAAAEAAAAAAAAAAEPTPTPAPTAPFGSGGPHTLTGSITAMQPLWTQAQAETEPRPEPGTPCTAPPYPDLEAGGEVTVHDAEGTLVAAGLLEAGTVFYTTTDAGLTAVCRFTFLVAGITTSASYTLEVTTRGPQPLQMDQLESGGWQVHLALGGA
jgi:hypothetical protein